MVRSTGIPAMLSEAGWEHFPAEFRLSGNWVSQRAIRLEMTGSQWRSAVQRKEQGVRPHHHTAQGFGAPAIWIVGRKETRVTEAKTITWRTTGRAEAGQREEFHAGAVFNEQRGHVSPGGDLPQRSECASKGGRFQSNMGQNQERWPETE